jgi:MFS family permease
MSTEEIKVIFERVDPKTGEDVDDSFDVVVTKNAKIIFAVLWAVLFGAQAYYFINDAGYVWAIFVYLAMTVVAILLWGFAGPKLAEANILKWLRKVKEKRKPKPQEMVLGFPRTQDLYYIEANPNDLNFSNGFVGIKTFLMRVQEVLFLAIGIQTFLAQTLAPVFFGGLQAKYDAIRDEAALEAVANGEYLTFELAQEALAEMSFTSVADMMIDTTIYLGPFALLLLFLVIPLIWMGEDMQIYRINEFQDNIKLGTYLRASVISKVLGFFGIIFLFNICQEYAEGTLVSSGLDPNGPEYMMAVYSTLFTKFFEVLLYCAAAPTAITLVYLVVFHSRWVNNVRIQASEFLPAGTVKVVTVASEELEHLTHPEKIELKEHFFTSKNGTILLIVMCVAVLVTAFYMGFIL